MGVFVQEVLQSIEILVNSHESLVRYRWLVSCGSKQKDVSIEAYGMP